MKIVHALRESDGPAVDAVKLTDRDIIGENEFGSAKSGVRFGADGILYRFNGITGVSAIVGEWLVAGTSPASSYYVKRTILSGTLETDAGENWLQMNADRDFVNIRSNTGTESASVFYEISSDMSGTPVVTTATHNYTSIQGQQ